MKKILLASTILVGTAGFAAAEVSFSGSAFMGVESQDGGTTWWAKSSVGLDASLSGETDGGLMFGADFTVWGWDIYANSTGVGNALNALGTAAITTFMTGTWNDVSVWVSGDFGKVSLDTNLTSGSATLAYSNTIDAFSIDVGYDIVGAVWDVEVGYSFGDYSVYAGYNTAGAGTARMGGDATFGDFSVYVDLNDVSAISTNWEIGAEYTSGAITVGGDIGNDGTNFLDLNAAYDLGGGASVIAEYGDPDTATASDETITLGIAMEF